MPNYATPHFLPWQVVYSNTEKTGIATVKPAADTQAAEEEDDFDIDAI